MRKSEGHLSNMESWFHEPKHWEAYLDSKSLLIQKNGDGGDSLNRTCHAQILTTILDIKFLKIGAIGQLNHPYRHGRFRRSWHEGKWYAEYDRMSRDQFIPLLMWYGIAAPKVLWWIFLDHLKRGLLFTYNTRRNYVYALAEEHYAKSPPDVKWRYEWKCPDLTGPEVWGLYIRGFWNYWLYPLLWIFDIETVLSSIVIRLRPKKDDCINHAVILEYQKYRMPTLLTYLANLITPRSLLQKRLDTFFGKDDEPPLNEIYYWLGKVPPKV